MTPDQWTTRFAEVSAELERIAAAKGGNPDDNVSECEGALLEELDEPEFTAGQQSREGAW